MALCVYPGGGGAVGRGVYRALFSGDVGGGGTMGVVYSLQGPTTSGCHSASRSDQPARYW